MSTMVKYIRWFRLSKERSLIVRKEFLKVNKPKVFDFLTLKNELFSHFHISSIHTAGNIILPMCSINHRLFSPGEELKIELRKLVKLYHKIINFNDYVRLYLNIVLAKDFNFNILHISKYDENIKRVIFEMEIEISSLSDLPPCILEI